MKGGKEMSMQKRFGYIFDVHHRNHRSFITKFTVNFLNTFCKGVCTTLLYHFSVLFFKSIIWTSPLGSWQNSVIAVESICKDSSEKHTSYFTQNVLSFAKLVYIAVSIQSSKQFLQESSQVRAISSFATKSFNNFLFWVETWIVAKTSL